MSSSWAIRRWCAFAALTAAVHIITASAPQALEVVLKDVAPDRIERQRHHVIDDSPLPGTPDLAKFDARLSAIGAKVGDHVFLRIFKQESEMELWLRKGDQYVHFATYPICFWSGTLGPKLVEGDKQTPEGFYTLTRRQLHLIGRWPRSLNMGFPNVYDRQLNRSGSYILIHGGCSSVGCYAMTDNVLKEVYRLTSAALRGGGQKFVHVHAMPFRMTDSNMSRHAGSRWLPFWSDLKAASDLFERTHVPPQIGVCDQRYVSAAGDVKTASRSSIRMMRPTSIEAASSSSASDEGLVCRKPPADAHPDSEIEREARAVAPVRILR